ncbi:glycerol-3-phosphate dehydrogenase/oxidase [Paenibacillus glucanolyticus]|uniref:glycerol-3-phosphate dehydrogenase/oxidase n=1 Tax=Paenibacillus glucanolyticus TaxID=59843 RepID=UPI00096DECED|nr:glycerol-3-phosphate dehydrogenase/oxidase [Paenibacillus glucanolyticus]OMF81013.1 glycerol-3-phosphate dehydrogenase [Paenibacillus glucanolyticus]
MGTSLSARMRTQYLQDMSASKLDVLVIGGGITGAGIAWDASCRGMAVGLVEMGDLASGTSSRSTKLIHAGLRYLRQGELGLVREAGYERALLHRSAPHLVEPIPMLMPIYKKGTYGYLARAIGLYLHDWLAGVKGSERVTMFRREGTLALEPLLRKEGLRGCGYYYEYRTDDARLTVEVMKSARARGALIANYAKVCAFIYRGGRVVGAHVEDQWSGETYEVFAKKIVNATGLWADQVRQKDNSLKGRSLLFTKGVHLVVDHAKLPIRQAAYFDVPGGRMIFVIPREGKTYIGTTDTVYEGATETPGVTAEDRRYLLDAVRHAFPDVHLKISDIEAGWSGLRPLVREEGKGPSEISGKDEMVVSDSGLITIAGGKLTGFRKMAEKVVNLAARQLQEADGTIYPPCTTDRVPISGGELNGLTYEELREMLVKQGKSLGIPSELMLGLMTRYGSNTKELLHRIHAASQASESMEIRVLRAEIQYSIEHEMTITAVDFLLRRTGWVLFDRPRAERLIAPVIEIMKDYLEWSQEEVDRQLELLQDQLQLAWGAPAGDRTELFPYPLGREHVEMVDTQEKEEDSPTISAMIR